MNIEVTIEVWKKGKWFIAKCPELDFVSQGRTHKKAKENLIEVINIQFEEMDNMGTLDDYLAECGYEKKQDGIFPHTEMIEHQKHSLPLQ